MIGVDINPPIDPTLDIVKVESCTSVRVNLFSLAFFARSDISDDIWTTDLSSAFFTTATVNPDGVSIATPILISFLNIYLLFASS